MDPAPHVHILHAAMVRRLLATFTDRLRISSIVQDGSIQVLYKGSSTRSFFSILHSNAFRAPTSNLVDLISLSFTLFHPLLLYFSCIFTLHFSPALPAFRPALTNVWLPLLPLD